MDDQEFEKRLRSLDQLQSACTGCGLCLEGCATYQLSGWEHESPRGRIHLAAQFMHGRIRPESSALSTFDRCLGCRACEPLCPHQVSYHKIRGVVQELRSQLNPNLKPAMERSTYKRWATLARRVGNHLWRRYGAQWLCIPSLSVRSNGSFAKRMQRPKKEEPILAICCMEDLFQHDVIQDALDFMHRIGYALKIDRQQPCCGAIFERLINGGEESVAYDKEKEAAAALQKKSLHSFLNWLSPNTYFLAKGCQCFISAHASHAMDLYHLIENIFKAKNLKLHFRQPTEIYYQPYCRTGSEKDDPVWRLLNQITGLQVRLISHPQACCGGYCGETLLHPARAEEMAAQKMEELPPGATLVVTSPDCWGLFKRYASEGLNILYPIQLFAQAQTLSASHS